MDKDPETLEEAIEQIKRWRELYCAKLQEISEMNEELYRIRAEARAEAGKAAYNHAEVFQRRLASAQEALLKYPSIVTKLVRGYGIDVNEKQITIWLERELAAILADEPKEERGAEGPGHGDDAGGWRQ